MKNRKLGGVGFSEKDLSMNHKLLCESSIILVGKGECTDVYEQKGSVWCDPAVFSGCCRCQAEALTLLGSRLQKHHRPSGET